MRLTLQQNQHILNFNEIIIWDMFIVLYVFSFQGHS